MRASWAFFVVSVLAGTVLLLGFWGCGTGPLEQSYSVQYKVPSVSSAIGEKTTLPELMGRIRTDHLYLSDRLTSGTPEQVYRAAVDLSVLAREVGNYQPAIARDGVEEAATFKRLAYQLQDMAVEVAKAASTGQSAAADQYYVSVVLTCNQCHRLFRGVTKPTPPIDIPELEVPKPPAEEPREGAVPPAPAPEPTPSEPPPAPPEQ